MAKLTQFLGESSAELKKVVWPKKDEVLKSTGVTVIVVLVVSVALFVMDQSIEGVLDLIFR